MAHVDNLSTINDDSFTLTMLIARVFGVAPIRFTSRQGTTEMYISRLAFAYGLTFFGLIILGVQQTFFANSNSGPEIKSQRNFHLINTSFLSTTFLVSYGILYGMKRLRCFMYCIEQIYMIKKSIKMDYNCKTGKWLYCTAIFFFMSLIGILGLLDIWCHGKPGDVRPFMYYIFSFILIIMEIQFLVVAMSVKSAFRFVNKALEELLHKIGKNSELHEIWGKKIIEQKIMQIPVKSINSAIDLLGITDHIYPDVDIAQRLIDAQKIRQLTYSFVTACDVLRVFNESESVLLFLQLALFCLNLVVTIYNSLKTLPESSVGLIRLLQFVWFLYHISRILILIEPCCRTQEELINTRFLVGRIMCYVTSEVDPMHDEIEDFFKQLMLNEPSYSAMGICSIGRPLISTIIGTVTTILVLIYEF